MSVIENIQKIFKTKPVQTEDSMEMSTLGMPGDRVAAGVGVDVLHGAAASQAMHAPQAVFAPSRMASIQEDGPAEPENPDLLRLPLLGRRTLGQHQKILVVLLARAVPVPGVVAVLDGSGAGRVAREGGARGRGKARRT